MPKSPTKSATKPKTEEQFATITVTQTFRVPLRDGDFDKGTSLEMAKGILIQNAFDGTTQYQIRKHLEDVLDWKFTALEKKDIVAEKIVEHHKEWADILQAARVKFDVEFPEGYQVK